MQRLLIIIIGLALSLILLGSFSALANVSAGTVSRAQLNYMLQCQGCHKADGGGIPGSVPDLKTYAITFLSQPKGRQYYVGVPGSANSPLTDKELAEVLNFILVDIIRVDATGQANILFSESEVTNYRQRKIADVEALRLQLISASETMKK